MQAVNEFLFRVFDDFVEGSSLHMDNEFFFLPHFIDVAHGPCTKSISGFLKNWATTSYRGALREPTHKFPTSPAS
jgi:hypothetical protein